MAAEHALMVNRQRGKQTQLSGISSLPQLTER